MAAPDVVLLKRAVLAFRSGDKPAARDLLAEAAEHNPDNELVWLWTASAARTRNEAYAAVERVLALNPENEKALQWIEKLRPSGYSPAQEEPRALSNGAAAAAETERQAREARAPEEREEAQAAAQTADMAEETARTEQGAQEESETIVEQSSSEVAEEESAASPKQAENAGEVASSNEDAESRLAALEASIESAGRSRLDESGEATAGSTDEYGLEQAAAEHAAVESDPAGQSREEVAADPLTELLGSKPKKPEPKNEEDVWAALGMAGMQEASPAAKPETAQPAATAEALESEKAVEKAREASAVPPAQTVHAEVEQDESCFICEKLAKPQEGLCSVCRAIVDLELMDLAPRHEGADRGQLTGALERVREELESTPTSKLFIQAALICLNLRQSHQARLYLREAVRLRPHDRELIGYYDQIEKRPLILAVDDSKTVQKMISTVLEKEAYRVVQAEDGLGAIAKLDEELPRLILLDITMPRMDGYQVCKVITGNEATKHIPVIMLSGKDGFFDKVRGKMVGASNYITKPFDPAELTKTIAKFLKN